MGSPPTPLFLLTAAIPVSLTLTEVAERVLAPGMEFSLCLFQNPTSGAYSSRREISHLANEEEMPHGSARPRETGQARDRELSLSGHRIGPGLPGQAYEFKIHFCSSRRLLAEADLPRSKVSRKVRTRPRY